MSLRRALFDFLPGRWQRTLRRRKQAWLDRQGAKEFRRNVNSVGSLRIVVGASGTRQAGWIPSDIGYLNLLRPAQWTTYFTPGKIDAILAEHVWEHLTLEEGKVAARTCHQFLKPDGYLRVAVPDGFHPDPAYRSHVEVGGVGFGADDHKVLYNHQTFVELFEGAGFSVTLLEFFDANGKFHAVAWDPADGMIRRSRRFDPRNRDGELRYTSLILDARKPL